MSHFPCAVVVGSSAFHDETALILSYFCTNVRFLRKIFRLGHNPEPNGIKPDIGWIILADSALGSPLPPHTSAPDHRSAPRTPWGIILQQGRPSRCYGYRITSSDRMVVYESSEDLPGELEELLHRMFPDKALEKREFRLNPHRDPGYSHAGLLNNAMTTIAWMLTLSDPGADAYSVFKDLHKRPWFGGLIKDLWNDAMRAIMDARKNYSPGQILVFRNADAFLSFLETMEREDWEIVRCAADKFCDGVLASSTLEEYARAREIFGQELRAREGHM